MKKIFLTVILCLLISTTANAEGAWVLWEGRDKNIGSDTIWTAESAFPSYSMCIERINNICAYTSAVDFKAGICTKFNYLGYAAWYYKCLPDTIDPRK